MDEQLMKSLVELIDETIAEVEELKKSERFSSSDIKMDGVDGIKMAGQKDANGSMDKADDDDDEEDKDDDGDEDDKKKPPFMKKGEGTNRQADPNGGKLPGFGKADKDDDEDEEDKDDMEKGEGENRQADPNGGKHLAKSLQHSESLMKSYVEGRLAPIEDQLRNIAGMVEKMFKTPMASRSQGYKSVSPLMKSEDAGEPLTKSQILDTLEGLHKSGKVTTQEMIAAEIGSSNDLAKLVNKYNIKN